MFVCQIVWKKMQIPFKKLPWRVQQYLCQSFGSERCFGAGKGYLIPYSGSNLSQFSQQSQDYLILVGSSQLFVGKHDRVENDHLQKKIKPETKRKKKSSHISRHGHIGSKDCDGRIELTAVVEKGRVLHFGKRFVWVWVVWGSLHP